MNVFNPPQLGSTVWVVYHHHSWDAALNNTYFPVPRTVTGVGSDTVRLKDDADRPFADCYLSEEQCEAVCPEPHMDE